MTGAVALPLPPRGNRPAHAQTYATAVAFALATALLVTADVASWLNASHMADVIESVERTQDVLEHLEGAAAAVNLIVAATRGFVAAGTEALLLPATRGRVKAMEDLSAAERLLAGDPAQQARLAALRARVQYRIDMADGLVQTRRDRGLAPAADAISHLNGEGVVEDIRARVLEMQAVERDRLARRRSEVAASRSRVFAAMAITGVMSTGVLVAVFVGLRRQVVQRQIVEERLRQLNADLDRKVTERTAQLEATNQELEAFSYSVSHDLRAPLRAIDGFSHALAEEYAEQLRGDGRRYLARIRAGVGRMGTLIDDLLRLSRITREPMRSERVDLSALARQIVADLKAADPSRQVGVAIAPRLVARGDGHLLRAALTNLLGNAWKFTRHQPSAAVEVGSRDAEGERIFYVRDNGVGFDMAHAGQLFRAFQRLHGVHEFEGNGVGLATVQRIIGRHGGRVWAEGAVGQGATFHFTVPVSDEGE